MNIPSSAGKSSSKRQENGDRAIETERPLKKARFAWQVKGKYHLKNENAENINKEVYKPEVPEKASSSSESDSNDLVGNTEQNLEILGDYLLKQDFNTLDSVITDDDKDVLPSTSVPNNKIEYPRYVSSYSRHSSCSPRKLTNEKLHSPIPMSMVLSHSYSEDQCIARWQARQMAKGFVDNTINRVLDSWLVAPLPAEIDNNRFLALDVAEFINNLPGDNSVENEGILMAISAHGLQNTSSSSSCDDEMVQCSSSSSKCDKMSPMSSPKPLEDDMNGSLNNSSRLTQDSDCSNLDMSWTYSEETMKRNANDLSHLALFPDSSPHCQYYNETENLHAANREYDNIRSNNGDIDNYDFLDAAVSFAIQNKGLTSYGTDYG
ncbi:uncharacterized protein [Battus philenor]|uniref:uncharacterized protein n=1 Tax=Battus philenor TaxID=42288 RepID=UPI0035D00015